jgi:2-iminobutanoate/2-iminopropanoate deaminase
MGSYWTGSPSIWCWRDGENILKVNVYVTSVEMFLAVNEVYRRYFPKDPPARIFVNVPAWNGGFDIEVDCIAAV